MDWCDKDAPPGALDDLWQLIRDTPMLDWQMLTKRATLIKDHLPPDWGEGYDNVWLGVTVENMEYGYPRIRALEQIPAKVRFLSVEPLLEHLEHFYRYLHCIHWVIVGGESGPGFRPMPLEAAVMAVAECEHAGIPIWFKQHGGNTKDKGGFLLGGREYKQWPRSAAQ